MLDVRHIFARFEKVHIFALALAGTAPLNLFTIHRPSSKIIVWKKPLVSILIPARNEEHTIARCLRLVFRPGLPPL